jgi:hypothetical protein
MNDHKKLAAARRISGYEIHNRPGPPSKWMRDHETSLLMEMVKLAHEAGHKFDGWPTFTLTADNERYYGPGEWVLRSEVKSVPA